MVCIISLVGTTPGFEMASQRACLARAGYSYWISPKKVLSLGWLIPFRAAYFVFHISIGQGFNEIKKNIWKLYPKLRNKAERLQCSFRVLLGNCLPSLPKDHQTFYKTMQLCLTYYLLSVRNQTLHNVSWKHVDSVSFSDVLLWIRSIACSFLSYQLNLWQVLTI